MLKFIKDFFKYPFQKDKSNNKINLMMTSLFKDFPANFWTKPTFKKIFVAPLLVLYYFFSE
jgi:hypothetical protein